MGIIPTLLDKRSELLGLLELKHREIKELDQQIAALDIALKIFDKDIDLRHLKGKRVYKGNKLFEHGELSKLVLDTLRVRGMSYDELLKEIMTIKVIEDREKKVLDKVLKVALANLVKGNKLGKVDDRYYIVGV